MRTNRRADMTPFDMKTSPKRQSALLLPVVWLASRLSVRGGHLKIQKQNMEGLKPPYLVLSMHQGFTDYFITPMALFPHRASYVSDMEGFANYGKRLYGMAGCVPTRRFVHDAALVKSIRHVVTKNRDIIVVFPEARHSNVGTNAELPPSVGKLIKLLGLPVVVQKLRGSYLTLPIWDEKNPRRAPLTSTLERVLTPEDIRRMAPEELTALANRHFAYDEYQWQYENKIAIDNPNRAHGLHRVLYQCPCCGEEHRMESGGSGIWCTACGKRWEMDLYGRLAATEGPTEFPHIPHWYEHQREQVKRQIQTGAYALNTPVRVEALPNEKGFVPLGNAVLAHTTKGFTLCFEETGEVKTFPAGRMNSVHTEYDYRDKGDCIVLSTRDCCYYLYAPAGDLGVTKIQFATEAFYENHRAARSRKRE